MFDDLTGQVWQPQPFTKDLDLYSLTLDWDLGWADFVSATGWSDTSTMYQLDSTIQFGEFANLQLGLPEPGLSRLRYNLELRSEEHTSELQSLMRISYAVFCLKKK